MRLTLVYAQSGYMKYEYAQSGYMKYEYAQSGYMKYEYAQSGYMKYEYAQSGYMKYEYAQTGYMKYEYAQSGYMKYEYAQSGYMKYEYAQRGYMKYDPDTCPSNTNIKCYLFDVNLLENQFSSYDIFVLSKLLLLQVRPYQIHYTVRRIRVEPKAKGGHVFGDLQIRHFRLIPAESECYTI